MALQPYIKREKWTWLILMVLLIAYAIWMYPGLSDPLFWDELGVYGRAVLYLLDHKISILPGDLNPELSRGHPMLFVYITALWTNLFGGTLFSAHVLMLLISLGLVASVYFIGSKLFNTRVGLMGSIFILIQPLFNGQTLLILPEMTLALFILWAVYFLLRDKHVWYFLFGSFAILTKETAIVLPVAAVIGYLIYYRKVSIVRFLIYLTPVLVFALFLGIQKIQNGWFLFPYHTDLVRMDPGYFIKNFFSACYFLFVAQGRYLFSGIAVICLAFGFSKGYLRFKRDRTQITFLTLLVVMMLFSSINFYMNRYFLLVFPLIGLSVLGITDLLKPKFKWLTIVLALTMILPMNYQEDLTKFNYDVDLGYKSSVSVMKSAIHFLEKQEHVSETTKIYCDFPVYFALKDQRHGYLQRFDSLQPTKSWDDDWHYALVSTPSSYELPIWDSTQVELLKSFRLNYAEVSVYRRTSSK